MTDNLPQAANQLPQADNYQDKFSVYRWMADGERETVCSNATIRQAANEFLRASNNFSAKSGITDRVMVVDWTETAQLLWESGKGYTYNGRLFTDLPILEDEEVWH